MSSYQSNSWSSASTTRVGVKVQMPQITFTLVTIVRTLVPDEVAQCYTSLRHSCIIILCKNICERVPIAVDYKKESTTTLFRDREIHPSDKDLQSSTRLAESWMLQIFDTRVDFPVSVQSSG